jgi:glycosyltransferase involved in cell wall biosynthesis
MPNTRDLLTLVGATPRVRALVSKHDILRQHIVQTFPVSTTRLFSKGVDKVAAIFGTIAKRGLTTKLIVVNAHANGQDGILAGLRDRAEKAGLERKNLIITSEEFPDSASYGFTAQEVFSLHLCSNVFLFPSISEAGPLVPQEAMLAGCVVIGNAQVRATSEGGVAHMVLPFGKEQHGFPPDFDLTATAEAISESIEKHSNMRRAHGHMRSLDAKAPLIQKIVTDLPVMV